MLTFTLDTSCVIHASQRQGEAHLVDALVESARVGASLFLTTAYERDAERASVANALANADWLAQAPIAGVLPAPFRLDYSQLDGPDVIVSDGVALIDQIVRRIVLPQRLWAENVAEAAEFTVKDRRRLNDVQHLMAHRMAGHDWFVTSDDDDILSKAGRLATEAGIRVLTLTQAVDVASYEHVAQACGDARVAHVDVCDGTKPPQAGWCLDGAGQRR